MLAARGLRKSFGRQTVLRGIDLDLARSQTLAVLGRSGCGKTTLLKVLAGLLPADAGTIELDGRDLTRVPAEKRNVLYLYQEALLFPHLSVFDNVAFGLRLRRQPEGPAREAVSRLLSELDLAAAAEKMPHQLSGGQKQRVAFGRALIVDPDLLLLDEPFSNLDGETRTAMQQLWKRVAAAHRTTALFVTHSLKEAILMGDAVARMAGGVLTPYATREELLRDPESGAGEEIRFWRSMERSLEEPEEKET